MHIKPSNKVSIFKMNYLNVSFMKLFLYNRDYFYIIEIVFVSLMLREIK